MANKPTIKIGHIKITDHLVLGVTKDHADNGKTQFENFNLETQRFVGWNPLGDALKNGDIDGAFILAPFGMELFYSGVKIRLTSLGHKSGSIIVTNKRANIKKIEDFKGKTVLIPHSLSIHNLIFEKLLRENGITTGTGKDVIFEVVAPSQIPQIMEWDETGSVGGFIVAEPFGSQVVKEGYGEEFALSKDIWPNHPCCVVVMNEDVINKHPDAVMELTRSFVDSGKFIEDDPDAAAEIGAKFLEQKVEVVKRVLTEPKDRVSTGDLYPVLDDLDFIQTYLTETINAMSGKIDLETFVDKRFMDEVGE